MEPDYDDELLDELGQTMENEDKKKLFPEIHVHIHAGSLDVPKESEGGEMPTQEEIDEMMKRVG